MKNKIITVLFATTISLINPLKLNAQSEYTQPRPVNLNTFSKECVAQINKVNNELISKEGGIKRGYEMYDGNFVFDTEPNATYYPKDDFTQKYEVNFRVYSSDVMSSPKLQLYWANLVNFKCSEYFHTVSFSVPQSDYYIFYLQKDGVMIPTEKETPNIVGLPYSKARQIIINTGWEPVSFDQSEAWGYEQFVVSLGYEETFSCAGTGVGACQFYFQNPDVPYVYLDVNTEGQFSENGLEGIIKTVEQYESMGEFSPN